MDCRLGSQQRGSLVEQVVAYAQAMAERLCTEVMDTEPKLDAMEKAVLAELHGFGNELLSGLVSLCAPAYPAASVACGCGEQAQYQRRVTYVKKGGNQLQIPYAITVTYERPPTDTVPPELQVVVPDKEEGVSLEINTAEAAIEVYMQAYRRTFHGHERRQNRTRTLQLFQQYLAAQGHSLMLKDLTLADGQGFLDSLANGYTGLPLSQAQKGKYRSGLRSFSRFLHELGTIEENIFLAVTRE